MSENYKNRARNHPLFNDPAVAKKAMTRKLGPEELLALRDAPKKIRHKGKIPANQTTIYERLNDQE